MRGTETGVNTAVAGIARPLQGPPRAVLFDLDGTLVDTAPDLAAAVNRLRVEDGRAALDEAELRPLVSKGGRALLARAYPESDPAALEARLPRFLAAYAEALVVHSRPFPGIEALLDQLESHGCRWGIVTNKPEALARGVLAGLGWTARCAVLVGGDTLPLRKPDPAPLAHAVARLGVPPGACAYVGDDARDIAAGNAAGMPTAVALWGYREAGDCPSRWPASAHCADAGALAAWLGMARA